MFVYADVVEHEPFFSTASTLPALHCTALHCVHCVDVARYRCAARHPENPVYAGAELNS